MTRRKTSSLLLKILGLAAAYFITGKLGTLLALPPGYATSIWPPSGIALAGVLFFGYTVWPGIWLGSCLVNFGTTVHALASHSIFHSILIVAFIGMGASLQAMLGAFLIRRTVQFPSLLEEEREVLSFLALGGPIACLVSATVGVTTLFVAGLVPRTNVLSNWATWWIGDSIGVIVVTPILLLIIAGREKLRTPRQLFVIFSLVVTFLAIIILFVYSNTREQAQIQQDFRHRAYALSRAVQVRLAMDVRILRITGSLIQMTGLTDERAIRTFIIQTFPRVPELQAILWGTAFSPRIIVYQQDEYFNESRLRANSVLRRELETVLRTGTPSATGAIDLTGDRRKHASILIAIPANSASIVGGVYRIDDIVAEALRGLDDEGIDLRITDETFRDNRRIIYTKWPSEKETGRLHGGEHNPRLAAGVEWNTPIEIAGRHWIFHFSETQEYLIAHRSWHVWLVLIAGLVFTSLLGAFLLVVARRTAKVETLVAQRTASLEASESRLRSVMESAQEAIITCDKEGRIVSWNRAAEAGFGYRQFEVTGKPLFILIPDPMVRAGTLSALVGRTLEMIGVRKDGARFDVELSMTSWKTDDQQFFSAFLRDITERKKMDQMKTDFVSFASHQLKTPLAEIGGFVDNMLSGVVGTFTEKQKKYLAHIKNATTGSLRLVSDLLSVSKVEQGMLFVDIKPVKLASIVEAAISDFRSSVREKGLELIVQFEDRNLEVLADFNKAVEAIKNAIDNALKFTDHGSIWIRTEHRDGKGMVGITDTGAGMDEALLQRLFTKALVLHDTTDAKGGSGLGLYIARSFMLLQGGNLTAESAPGAGSTFSFTFRESVRT